MLDCRRLIKNISRERIFAELSKLLCGRNVRAVLTEFSDILGEFIPEINAMKGFEQHNFHHIYDVLTHTAVVVENTPPLLHLRLAALFHDIGKPSCFSLDENGTGHFYSHASKSALIAERCLNELRCDNKTRDAVIRLVKLHDTPIEESERIIKRRLASMGSELFSDLIKLADVPQQIAQAAHMVHVGMGNKDIGYGQQIYAHGKGGMRAIFACVKPVNSSANFQGQGGMVTLGHRLCTGTTAEDV